MTDDAIAMSEVILISGGRAKRTQAGGGSPCEGCGAPATVFEPDADDGLIGLCASCAAPCEVAGDE